MRPKVGEPRSGCAINVAVEVIGDRWSLPVLRDIMFEKRRHFRVASSCFKYCKYFGGCD